MIICSADISREAIKIFEKGEPNHNLALAYIHLADKLGEKRELEQATEAAEKALKISYSINNLVMQGRSLVTLAVIAHYSEKFDLADSKLKEAEKLAKKVQNIEALSNVYNNWSVMCEQRWDADTGLKVCDRWLSQPISSDRRRKVIEIKLLS